MSELEDGGDAWCSARGVRRLMRVCNAFEGVTENDDLALGLWASSSRRRFVKKGSRSNSELVGIAARTSFVLRGNGLFISNEMIRNDFLLPR